MLFVYCLLASSLHGAADWHRFRGPNGDGTVTTDGPVTWSEHENVRWKKSIPGEGWSSPVIAGDRIWLTSSLNSGRSLRALCVDAASGRLLWDVEVFRVTTPEPIDNRANTHASPTPFVERGRLFVSYGTHGNAALDAISGKVLWRNQELQLSHDRNGPGSSPLVYSNLFIIPCDGLRQPYIAALHADTGKIAWRTVRSKRAGKAFSTPMIVTIAGESRVLSTSSRRCNAYDPSNGQEVWAVDLPGNTIVPTPVVSGGLAFVCTGFPKPELWALRLQGTGLVDESQAVAWKYKKQVPEVSSPVLVSDKICFISNNGIFTCLDAATGEENFSERLGGRFFASPVAPGSHIYLSDDQGKTFVVSVEKRLTILATNMLSEGCHASPAIMDKTLYLRTSGHLYRIGE